MPPEEEVLEKKDQETLQSPQLKKIFLFFRQLPLLYLKESTVRLHREKFGPFMLLPTPSIFL